MRHEGNRERLSPADASNVVMDAGDQVNVFLMAGVLGRGGFVGDDGTPDLDRLRDQLATRLDGSESGLERFGQRVGREGRALVWQPCRPDLAWHVRPAGPVDGTDGLSALTARLMTTPLPVDRPLWELLIVPGASPEGPGIILRVHHAVADGIAGVRLVQRLFDSVPLPERISTSAPAAAEAPARRHPLRALVAGVARVAAVFRAGVEPTVLLGPISQHRGVAFTEVDLAAVARGAHRSGGTINDALLAGVAVAAETTLRTLGEPVPDMLPASVPVALPGRGTSGNAVGVMRVRLPTDEPDPATRLAHIAELTRAAKAEARAQGTFELTRTRWGSRLFALLARRQRFVALFVTNVPGPAERLLIGGAPLEHAWPVAPIQGNVRLGIAAFSYNGRLGCAIHADADALDARILSRTLGDALDRIAAPASGLTATE